MAAGSILLRTDHTNRKARIYISGTQFDIAADQRFRRHIDSATTCLVLSTPTHGPEPTSLTLSDNRSVTVYTDRGETQYHCEFQVWKRSKDGSLTLYLDPTSSNDKWHMPTETSSGRDQEISSSESTMESVNMKRDELAVTNSNVAGSSSSSGLPRATVPSPDVTNGPPLLVERSLRSRVAYSERPSSRLLPKQTPQQDSIRMANVALCNDRVYCTIDCMKGLKVQMLTILCIFRMGPQIFVSEMTHFPPPSSLKRKERSRTVRPRRPAPYKKRYSSESEEEEIDYLLLPPDTTPSASDSLTHTSPLTSSIKHSTPPSPQIKRRQSISGNLLAYTPPSQQQTHLQHQSETASSRVSNFCPSSILSSTTKTVTSSSSASSVNSYSVGYLMDGRPQVFSSSITLPSPDRVHLPFAYSGGDISEPSAPNSSGTQASHLRMAGAFESSSSAHPQEEASQRSLSQTTRTVPSTGSAWNALLSNTYAQQFVPYLERVAQFQASITQNSILSVKNELAAWCLSGNAPFESKLFSGLLDIFCMPAFVGFLNDTQSFELLSQLSPVHAHGVFLLRLSKERSPWIDIYGVFRQQGAPSAYCATIRYHIYNDPETPLLFWLDTEMNADDSRSHSIVSLVSYICRITNWIPIDREFRAAAPSSASTGYLPGARIAAGMDDPYPSIPFPSSTPANAWSPSSGFSGLAGMSSGSHGPTLDMNFAFQAGNQPNLGPSPYAAISHNPLPHPNAEESFTLHQSMLPSMNPQYSARLLSKPDLSSAYPP